MANKTDVVFVNSDKHRRAVDLVALANGKRSPKNTAESESQTYWAEQLEGVAAAEQVQTVYEKLGGLVRTHAEEAKAKVKKIEMSAALKKSKKDGDKKGKK